MKLRLDKNSLRLRVRKSDLEKLQDQNEVAETTHFPLGSFEYRLIISDKEENVSAQIFSQSIEVVVPVKTALQWMNSDETGIYHTINLSDNQSLDVIIEKDFPCKDRIEENKADTFVELADKNIQKDC